MFRRLTMGKPMIMGRKTWASLKGPLDGRDNIVITNDTAFEASGAIVVSTIDDAMRVAHDCAAQRNADEIMVIGGAQIFAALLPHADRMYWTCVEADIDGDVYFPGFDRAAWRTVSSEPLPRTERDEFDATLHVLQRDKT